MLCNSNIALAPGDEMQRLVAQYQQQPCRCNKNENLEPATETCKCQVARVSNQNESPISILPMI